MKITVMDTAEGNHVAFGEWQRFPVDSAGWYCYAWKGGGKSLMLHVRPKLEKGDGDNDLVIRYQWGATNNNADGRGDFFEVFGTEDTQDGARSAIIAQVISGRRPQLF